MQTNTDQTINSFSILLKLVAYKWILLQIAIATAILSAAASFLIPVQYNSNVVLFPAPSMQVSKALLSNEGEKVVFGSEQEVEQLLQTLNSNSVSDRIIEKHHLFKHYHIDSTDNNAKYKLQRKIAENVSFSRTEFMAIQISVFDEDPQKAADIANDYAYFLDLAMNETIKKRAEKAFSIVKNEYLHKTKTVKMLQDSLTHIMSKGIYDYESQSEVYSQTYAEAIAENNLAGAKKVKKELDTLAKYASIYVSLRSALYNESNKLTELTVRYNEAKLNATQNLPKLFIINKAESADKKAKPQRAMIIIASTAIITILSFVLLLFRDTFSEITAKENE